MKKNMLINMFKIAMMLAASFLLKLCSALIFVVLLLSYQYDDIYENVWDAVFSTTMFAVIGFVIYSVAKILDIEINRRLD